MENLNFRKPRSLVNQIKYDLSVAIISGDLQPGQQLKEIELQEMFSVSRAPIREALRILEGDGLVVVDDYKKRYVRRITKKDLEEIFPLMALLEGRAARQAASIITKEKIEELKQINKEMREAFKRKKYDLCAELNYNFHSMYIKMIDNQALNRAIRCLSRGSVWLWLTNIYYTFSKLIPISISEHERIIAAFRKRNAEAAEEEVREHIMKVFERSIEHSVFSSEGDYILTDQGESEEI